MQTSHSYMFESSDRPGQHQHYVRVNADTHGCSLAARIRGHAEAPWHSPPQESLASQPPFYWLSRKMCQVTARELVIRAHLGTHMNGVSGENRQRRSRKASFAALPMCRRIQQSASPAEHPGVDARVQK
jgi:hypothetical protein